MEWLDFLLGGGLTYVFFKLGERRERRRRPKRIEAKCGCGHHRSFHKDDGPCNAEGWDPCRCQHYRGPKTLDDLIAEE